VRVFNLIDLDQVFAGLIQHPLAIEMVTSLLGPGFLISNFTANIALPGSQSMKPHSDQSIVVPEPWIQPWSINIIWCLNDVHAANGATLYLPMSHNIAWTREVPPDPRAGMVPFEAAAGSVIAMDGRLWHTSGANVTANEERALLFGYYARDFIRPQANWNAALSPATIAQLSPRMHTWLGLGPSANIRLAAPLVTGRDA
jgi:fumagillin biosynthesis dioxygenase